MHSTPNEPSPRGPDDRKRASAQYYDTDLYSPVSYTEAQRSPTRSAGAAVEAPLSQPRQNQQPMAPGEQGRPPVTSNGPVGRGAANSMPRAQPPSYPGPSSEEFSNNRTKATVQRQQQGRRGYRRMDSSGEEVDQVAAPLPSSGRSESISHSNQSVPVTRTRPNHSPSKNRPKSPEPPSPNRSDSSLSPGNTIPRLNSPSVMTSVLQPLDGKVTEYSAQMDEAQKQIAQLDSEMAILQERRREAQNRYSAAKMKHDDYRRQYQGVERALRGEPNVSSPMIFEDSDDERPSTQHTARPPQTPGASSRTDSWSSQQPKTGSRFRLSKLFTSA
ncbi:hypothetical protein BDZ45DRAFT_671818 [Acephala macrosclerotiorum]|nr:hypothetical protein BDZ45DRAFT_671818 [Acephala macrosclerotiorum]